MIMERLTLNAHAKLNLGLDVGDKREDGYHDIKTVMHCISLHDTITFTKSDFTEVHTDIPLSCDEKDNIVYKCAERFREIYGIKGSIKACIEKTIPTQAGLGGGSSDGAAAVYAMCMLYDIPFEADRLSDMFYTIGADIPFFFHNGACMCEGVGEQVIPTGLFLEYPCIIIKPDICISTGKAYGAIDSIHDRKLSDFDAIINCIRNNDLCGLGKNINNSFEAYAGTIDPRISELIAEIRNSGAPVSSLCGSGSSVFGIYENIEKAKMAYAVLTEKEKDSKIYLAALCRDPFEKMAP